MLDKQGGVWYDLGMETSTKSVVISEIAGNVQVGDVVRLPGHKKFRQVYQVEGATQNLSRRTLVQIHTKVDRFTVFNDTEIEYLIEVAR